MAHSDEESSFDKLLKSRYPLTYYLSRQQQFVNTYCTKQTIAAPTPPLPADPATNLVHKRKAPLPPPACFNVPDTLDFNATEYEQNDEINQSADMDEDHIQDYDETLLLKNMSNPINDSNSDIMNGKNSSLLQCSSNIQLEFSPYENNSPLRKAIQNGLNIIIK